MQQALAAALTSTRWVSVVGPPGVGKTLLARHLADEADHSAWVDARPLPDADAVLVAVVAALGHKIGPGETAVGSAGRALDADDTLLVVDGLDLDATTLGPLLQSLIESTSRARVVVTALTPAGEPAEHVVRVGPLPIPPVRSPMRGAAVDLFLGRLQAAGGPPCDVDAQAAELHRVLEATGGLPLLIEQAAAESALVGLANASAPQSVDQAVSAAYALLDDTQRLVLRRLSAIDFPVGMDVLAAIAGVPRPDLTPVVAALVRRSLVEADGGKFDMLSPIRQCVREHVEATDHEAVGAGLVEWADGVLPAVDNFGAADAPWLDDLHAMRDAVRRACAEPTQRSAAYGLANRMFSALYTAMRAREALDALESALASGDGPPAIGAQVARRAGIAASEVRGTYAGLSLLDRADEHATAADSPEEQMAKTASIRAEMHLDAGDLTAAEAEARRALTLDPEGDIVCQVWRTLADVHVSQGRFDDAREAAQAAMTPRGPHTEAWIALSARTLLARIALEQGRVAEAVAATRAVVQDAEKLAEDRVRLLAELVLRDLDRTWPRSPVDVESLPWAVRLPVMAQDARDLLADGDPRRAAGQAADVAALADSAQLGRDAVEARLLLGRALLQLGDVEQAATTLLNALEHSTRMPMPLRAADALDALASVAHSRGLRDARRLAAAAAALRAPRQAAPWGYASRYAVEAARQAPDGWIVDGELTADAAREVAAVFSSTAPAQPTVLDSLTASERVVAERVADGLTSRQIAEELFVSPRTVDAHLTHIYRKLGINTRARLAAIVVDSR